MPRAVSHHRRAALLKNKTIKRTTCVWLVRFGIMGSKKERKVNSSGKGPAVRWELFVSSVATLQSSVQTPNFGGIKH